jgi:hypothetical protein
MNSPIPQGFELKSKIADLSSAILERHPRMPTLLREIHQTLKQYPENVTLLSEEDIGVIVQGLEKQTNVFLSQTVTGAKGKSGNKSLATKIANLGDDAF